MAIQTGVEAPQFSLRSMGPDGLVDVNLSDYRGKNVVLLFFPAAFTGVCTQEMCDISQGLTSVKSDAVVLGISGDSAFAQDAWAKQNNITIPLLSDYSKTVANAYDVVLPDLVGMGPASKRAAFVIDGEGVIRYSEETATPLDLPNFDQIEAALSQLN